MRIPQDTLENLSSLLEDSPLVGSEDAETLGQVTDSSSAERRRKDRS